MFVIVLHSDHDKSNPYPRILFLYLFTLILSFNLHLVLPTNVFHSDFTTNILYAFLNSHCNTEPANFTVPHLIVLIRFSGSSKLGKPSSRNFLYLPLFLSSVPNPLLSTIVPSAVSLCSCHNVTSRVSNQD